MKNIFIALVAVLFVASLASAQTGTGSSLRTGGTQGVKSGMVGGYHDFTKTNYTGDTTARSYKGGSNSLCGYCHAMHIPANGVPTPLWNRASITTAPNNGPYGTYTSTQLDGSPAEVSASDNYSSFCLGCHDGSAMFAAAKYSKTPYVGGAAWPGTPGTPGFDTLRLSGGLDFSVNGEYGGLSHVHPVNLSYADAAANDVGLYPAPPAGQGFLFWDATNGAVGRLFDGKVQCSSCHNPHIPRSVSGIMVEGSSSYGALCVACHKK